MRVLLLGNKVDVTFMTVAAFCIEEYENGARESETDTVGKL